jgi:hypothetical protein
MKPAKARISTINDKADVIHASPAADQSGS